MTSLRKSFLSMLSSAVEAKATATQSNKKAY